MPDFGLSDNEAEHKMMMAMVSPSPLIDTRGGRRRRGMQDARGGGSGDGGSGSGGADGEDHKLLLMPTQPMDTQGGSSSEQRDLLMAAGLEDEQHLHGVDGLHGSGGASGGGGGGDEEHQLLMMSGLGGGNPGGDPGGIPRNFRLSDMAPIDFGVLVDQ